MKTKKIEHIYTWAGDLSNAVYGFIGVMAVSLAAASNKRTNVYGLILFYGYIIVAVLAIGFLIWRHRATRNYLKQRSDRLVALSSSMQAKHFEGLGDYHAVTNDSSELLSTLNRIGNNEGATYKNFVVSADWSYYDFSYSVYRRGRYGDYKSADVYYGVMKTKLPRPLPNVFFSSKAAGKRHIRFVFQRRQIYHLEGDFNNYFTAYFPQGYAIDSMSFITPDVMQALMAAPAYDAEIIGDSLFLYGPIYMDAGFQLTDMSAKILAIKKSLMQTAAAYTDDRLPVAQGADEVAPQGSLLKRTKMWTYVNIAVIIGALILSLVK